MKKVIVTREYDTVETVILKHKETGLYSYVNLSKGHICPCKFRTEEEALRDAIQQPNVVRVEVWERGVCIVRLTKLTKI